MLNVANSTQEVSSAILDGSHTSVVVNHSSLDIDVSKLDFVDLLNLSKSQSSSRLLDVQDFRRRQVVGEKATSPLKLDKFTADYIKDKWLLRYQSKRWIIFNTLERIVAFVILLAIFPTFLLIGACVRFSSRGPAIFRQKRLGHLCKPFTIYKFRTMVADAEATGPQWATENDSRYTRIGNFLRSTRLDELPQLWNIVKGDMSLIGFRPIRLHFADMLNDEIPYYELRFFVRPGITGWPQIWHDYAGSVEGQKRKFEYELYYLLHADFKMNLKIVFRTFSTMINRNGQ